MTSKKVKVESKEESEAQQQMDTKTDSEEDSSDDENPDIYKGDEGITVDFEGRNPIDSDLDGIKQMLGQLFVKAHIDLNELSGIIIAQNYVGSVLKQAYTDEEEDDDEDEDMEDPCQIVFGVTTAINVSNKQDASCMKQLQKLIFDKAEKYATDTVLALFREALQSGNKTTALLLNERFVNIPAAVCVPMFENLLVEIDRARAKGMPYKFDYFLVFVKYYQKAASGNKAAEVLYSNDEEEYFIKDCVASFDYSVQKETTTALAGNWLEEDEELQPFRKVLLIEATKLPDTIGTIKSLVASVATGN